MSMRLFNNNSGHTLFDKFRGLLSTCTNARFKIDMADEILVINVGGYIGDSTRSEIEYAERNGKVVNYLEPIER